MEAPAWITAVQFTSRGVLFVLVGLSVWSVAIMVDRYRAFKTAKGAKGPEAGGISGEARSLIAARDWNGLKTWAQSHASSPELATRLPAGALAAALETGATHADDGAITAIDRAVRSYLTLERTEMERGLTALATLGSNAPFIGLFGTVLGIIQAFGSLGSQSSGTTTVMTGISEALVATAIGLFVAIPAVIAYNVFSRRMRLVLAECDSLRDYYLSRLGSSHGR